MTIQPPQPPQWRGAVRTVIEHAAEQHWLTGGFVKLYRFTHPSGLEQAIEKWRADVSATVNDTADRIEKLEKILFPSLRVTQQAIAVGAWFSQRSPNGLGHPAVQVDDVLAAFPDMPGPEGLEAIAELEHLGMLRRDRVIGGKGFARPTNELFVAFDGVVHGWDTRADAGQLANWLLEHGDAMARRTQKLHELSGWEARRFNPAFAFLLHFVDDRHVSKEVQASYPASGFIMDENDRFQLRTFVRDASAAL